MGLDVDAECDRLFFAIGAATGSLDIRDERQKVLMGELLELMPFAKALCRVGLSHQNELMHAWKQALEEPMPFGCAPVGLPKEEP